MIANRTYRDATQILDDICQSDGIMDQQELAAACDRFLDLHTQLLKAGHHETAYDVLAAAADCAECLRDPERLTEIGRTATAHGVLLDRSKHTIPNSSAAHRGDDVRFASLVRTVDAMIARIKSARVLANNRAAVRAYDG